MATELHIQLEYHLFQGLQIDIYDNSTNSTPKINRKAKITRSAIMSRQEFRQKVQETLSDEATRVNMSPGVKYKLKNTLLLARIKSLLNTALHMS
ncbi:hypothetical protein PT974_04750 [Cladobotryum mycophilum]|uniref:Uncharacterized protein n=1 Tax=Cladobotryum mycophilum TaxID=491253 RepID=A0ABR0SQA3_9HYPO